VIISSKDADSEQPDAGWKRNPTTVEISYMNTPQALSLSQKIKTTKFIVLNKFSQVHLLILLF